MRAVAPPGLVLLNAMVFPRARSAGATEHPCCSAQQAPCRPGRAAAPLSQRRRQPRAALARPDSLVARAGSSGAGPGGSDAGSSHDQPAWNELLRGAEPERPEDAGRVTPDQLPEIFQMGSWRLRSVVCPEIAAMVAQVENSWRVVLGKELTLCPMPSNYKFMDSVDPGGAPHLWDSREDPAPGTPGHPRLLVENRAYASRVFRKLHLEVAVRQDGLQVLHCVMYPRPEFDLPILSFDLVASGGRVTLAVADPCPVTPNLSLPSFYAQPVEQLQQRYGLATNRPTPDWGAAIFSPLAVLLRPADQGQVGSFLKYAIALAHLHVQVARNAPPVASAAHAAEVRAAHGRYCAAQLSNDKTRRVLEKAFGAGVADDYMRRVMFDAGADPADELRP